MGTGSSKAGTASKLKTHTNSIGKTVYDIKYPPRAKQVTAKPATQPVKPTTDESATSSANKIVDRQLDLTLSEGEQQQRMLERMNISDRTRQALEESMAQTYADDDNKQASASAKPRRIKPRELKQKSTLAPPATANRGRHFGTDTHSFSPSPRPTTASTARMAYNERKCSEHVNGNHHDCLACQRKHDHGMSTSDLHDDCASDPHHNAFTCKLCKRLPNWKRFCDPIESATVWQTSFDNDTNYMPEYYLDGW